MKKIIIALLMSISFIASAHQTSADSLIVQERTANQEINEIVPNSVALIIVSAVVFILSLIAIDLLEKTNKISDYLLFLIVFILVILPFAAIGYASLYCKWLAVIEVIVLLIYFMPCWHDRGGGDGDWAETLARNMYES